MLGDGALMTDVPGDWLGDGVSEMLGFGLSELLRGEFEESLDRSVLDSLTEWDSDTEGEDTLGDKVNDELGEELVC